jgi:hypothetical protein
MTESHKQADTNKNWKNNLEKNFKATIAFHNSHSIIDRTDDEAWEDENDKGGIKCISGFTEMELNDTIPQSPWRL